VKIDSFNNVFNISTDSGGKVKSRFAGGVYFAAGAAYYRQSGAGNYSSTVRAVRKGCRLQCRTGCGRLAVALCGEKECIDVTSKSESGAEQLPAEPESEPAAESVPEPKSTTESKPEPAAEPVPESAAAEFPEPELPQSEPESGTESEPAEQPAAESLVEQRNKRLIICRYGIKKPVRLLGSTGFPY